MAASQPETGEIEVELGILHQKMRNFRKAVLELQVHSLLHPSTSLGPRSLIGIYSQPAEICWLENTQTDAHQQAKK